MFLSPLSRQSSLGKDEMQLDRLIIVAVPHPILARHMPNLLPTAVHIHMHWASGNSFPSRWVNSIHNNPTFDNPTLTGGRRERSVLFGMGDFPN